MVYEITDEIRDITINEINTENITIGLITLKDLKEKFAFFEFAESGIFECENDSYSIRSSIDVYDNYSFGILNIINVNDVLEDRDKIGFYVKKNLFLLVDILDNDKSTEDTFEYAAHKYKPGNVTLEKLIYSFFERLLYCDNKSLETIEYEINQLEEELTSEDTDKNFNNEILDLKKKLLFLRNYYEQLIDIGEELQENENDLFAEDDLRYFKLFTDKASRLSSNVQMLRENLVQLREAYQASLDFGLNSIMKVFTVVTTIFLPLTLIVGWYGMNFSDMPELSWKYGYPSVIVLTILVVVLCIVFFKKKKFL